MISDTDIKSFTRWTTQYENTSDRFRLKNKHFERQYAHIYSERLITCRKHIESAVRKKWGMSCYKSQFLLLSYQNVQRIFNHGIIQL